MTYKQVSMTFTEPLSIDSIVEKTLRLCNDLPRAKEYAPSVRMIRDLKERLAGGMLRIAVLGQFNRGKSTFINRLLGMEILPTSVLPITSVPTVITYGEVNECTITFSDKKAAVTQRGDEAAIYTQLLKYVTEKNNPKNIHNVEEATVKCNSQFLLHGTVIIDTPGFGSTHTHNTQTTLDLLSSCDAALFLLSADLPITQTEVDFLKFVIPSVPRIFFIYNKIDLLNSDELHLTQQFIKDILVKRLDFSSDVNLFPVSAKQLGRAHEKDKLWEQSGFLSVKTKIIDFLHHEKYFTLSEALSGKLRDAMSTIARALQENMALLNKPIAAIRESSQRMRALSELVRTELVKTRTFAEIEEKALLDFCKSILDKKRGTLHASVKRQMEKLCFSISGNNPESVINAALSQLFEEHFKGLSLHCITELNKPMRKATNAHVREFKKLCDTVHKELGGSSEDIEAKVEEKMELSSDQHWKTQGLFVFKVSKSSFFARFSSMDKKSKHLLDQYGKEIADNIELGIDGVCRHTKELVSRQVASFLREISAEYDLLQEIIATKDREMVKNYEEEQEKIKPELQQLQRQLDGFSEMLSLMGR
ncbi:MAG: dynamin family protein [Chitinivibrionales bacterium]|nr:dynamin family protein [Chitinivibrionales bacterium]